MQVTNRILMAAKPPSRSRGAYQQRETAERLSAKCSLSRIWSNLRFSTIFFNVLIKNASTREALLIKWRRRRDSNPRYAINVYSLSRGAPSATRPLLQILFISSRSDLPFALPGRALLGASHLSLRVAAVPPAILRSLGLLGQPLGHFS